MGPGEIMYVKVLGLGLSEHGCLTNSLGLFSSPQVIKDGKFCYARTITPQRYIYK